MKVKFFVFFYLFFSCTVLRAQEQASVESNLIGVKLSVFSPALEVTYERKLTNKSVFEGRIGTNFGFSFSSAYFGSGNSKEYYYRSSSYSISPTLMLSYKNYYNINKRVNKSKSIYNNSANYYGISLLNAFGAYVREKYENRLFSDQIYKNSYYNNKYVLLVVPKWGLNRPVGRKFIYSFELGPSLISDFNEAEVGLWIQTGFTFRFHK